MFAGLFTLVMLASVGLPGLNGFVGEYLTLLGTYLAYPVAGIIATFGVILSAGYALFLYRRAIFGVLDKPALASIKDMGPREIAIMAPLVILTIFYGVYPAPVLDVTQASVKKLVAGYELAIKTAKAEK